LHVQYSFALNFGSPSKKYIAAQGISARMSELKNQTSVTTINGNIGNVSMMFIPPIHRILSVTLSIELQNFEKKNINGTIKKKIYLLNIKINYIKYVAGLLFKNAFL